MTVTDKKDVTVGFLGLALRHDSEPPAFLIDPIIIAFTSIHKMN